MKTTTNAKQSRPLAALLAAAAMGLALHSPIHAQSPPASAEATLPSAEEALDEADYLPKRYSSQRYRPTVANNPFEREILPPPPPTPPTPEDPFDFKLVSVSSKGERYRVTVIDKKGQYLVVTDQPDGDGYHYSNIEPAAKIQDFRVQVAKGAQTEWVEFDTKRFSIASKALTPPRAPQNTAGRPAVVPNVKSGPPPRAPIPPTPAAAAAAQKSGNAAAEAIQRANAAAVQAGQERSRVSGRRVVLPPKNR